VAVTADASLRWLGGRTPMRAAVSIARRPAGLAPRDPAAARFGLTVTIAGPGRYPFRCQHPASAGMPDTFAVS